MSDGDEDYYPGLRRAADVPGGPTAAAAVTPSAAEVAAAMAYTDLAILPVGSLEAQKAAWNAYFQVKGFLFNDETCYDVVSPDGTRELNRTGATRLAMYFGLSFDIVNVTEAAVRDEEGNDDRRYRVVVRAGRGSRHAEGIASCRVSEIAAETNEKRVTKPNGVIEVIPGRPVPLSKREHFALTKASTRALKRAVADILGGTEAE